MKAPRGDFLANMKRGWGETPPAWVVALARECVRVGASAVGRRINYSVSAVSAVVSNSYSGDVSRIESLVRGALLSETLDCPVLGEIERDRCEREQSFKHFGTSAMRTRIHRACRSGCPNSRLKKEGGDGGQA